MGPEGTPRAGSSPRRWEHRAHQVAAAIAVIVAGMVPWTTYLALSLPERFVARNWDAAWVGFDAALIALLAFTAWAVWSRRQLMIGATVVAATLLVCDAWFDTVTSLGTRDQAVTLLTAFAGELPLAAFLGWVAWRQMTATVAAFHRLVDTGGDAPPLRRARLLATVAPAADEPVPDGGAGARPSPGGHTRARADDAPERT